MNALISWAVQACRQYLPMYLPPFVSCYIDVGLNSALLSSPVLISHYQLDRGALKVDKQASGREVFEAVNQYNGLNSKLLSGICFLPFEMWLWPNEKVRNVSFVISRLDSHCSDLLTLTRTTCHMVWWAQSSGPLIWSLCTGSNPLVAMSRGPRFIFSASDAAIYPLTRRLR